MAKKVGVGYERFKVFPADKIQPELPDIAQAIEDAVSGKIAPHAIKPKRKTTKW